MKKLIFSLFVIFLIGSLDIQGMSDIKDAILSDKEQKIDATLKAHPEITRLVVGCGKDPYKWKPSAENGENKWANDPDKGNHDHPDCLTLAETEDVQPNIVWDWTKPVPQCLVGRFTFIYLEKLPPRVLEQPVCMENLRACLKPGGIGVLDHQIYNIQATSYAIVSPFCISVIPPSSETSKKIEQLKALEAQYKSKFYQVAGVSENTSISKEAYEALLQKNPKLEQLNVLTYNVKATLSNIGILFMRNQQAEVLKLTGDIYEMLKKQMISLGFDSAEIQAKIKNPYNGRENAILVTVEKKK